MGNYLYKSSTPNPTDNVPLKPEENIPSRSDFKEEMDTTQDELDELFRKEVVEIVSAFDIIISRKKGGGYTYTFPRLLAFYHDPYGDFPKNKKYTDWVRKMFDNLVSKGYDFATDVQILESMPPRIYITFSSITKKKNFRVKFA
jgi:hypothetical protein